MKALAILLLAVALRSQAIDGSVIYPEDEKQTATNKGRRDDDEPSPPPKPKGIETSSICGAKPSHPDADHVQVSCVDYDALRRFIPTTMTGKETQVLIHARKGRDAGKIYVSVDGVNWRKGTQTLLGGKLVTLITFPGVGYKTVEIDIP